MPDQVTCLLQFVLRYQIQVYQKLRRQLYAVQMVHSGFDAQAAQLVGRTFGQEAADNCLPVLQAVASKR